MGHACHWPSRASGVEAAAVVIVFSHSAIKFADLAMLLEQHSLDIGLVAAIQHEATAGQQAFAVPACVYSWIDAVR